MQVFLILHFAKRNMSLKNFKTFRFAMLAAFFLLASIVLAFFMGTGRLGSFTSRIRSLFIPHTRTGNPLVDSVAEHQVTHPAYYARYLHLTMYFAMVGFYFLCSNIETDMTNGKVFAAVFSFFSFYFSSKMVRLLLLLSPAVSVLTGICVCTALDWSLEQLGEIVPEEKKDEEAVETKTKTDKTAKTTTSTITTTTTNNSKSNNNSNNNNNNNNNNNKSPKHEVQPKLSSTEKQALKKQQPKPQPAISSQKVTNASPKTPKKADESSSSKLAAMMTIMFLVAVGIQYYSYCFEISQYMSEPQIILRGKDEAGQTIFIDDFREAYWWLRDNTPQDSRVLSWWDYGYQINGIANRTTLADGNTWNHEHIALIGKCLVSDEETSYNITKHLADYVLIWTTRFAGMQSDDIAKMPHMGNIAGSVFPEVPRQGYYIEDGKPSPLMKQSLLYQLTFHGIDKKKSIPEPKYYKEAYTTSNQMVRIYKVKDSEKFRQPWTGKYPKEITVGQFRPE